MNDGSLGLSGGGLQQEDVMQTGAWGPSTFDTTQVRAALLHHAVWPGNSLYYSGIRSLRIACKLSVEHCYFVCAAKQFSFAGGSAA